MLKEAGFKQNLKVLGLVMNSLERARAIPDHHVRYCDEGNKNARVKSQSHEKLWYKLRNVDCEWACCECEWALKGNLCKHQIKVMIVNGLHSDKVVPKMMAMYKETSREMTRKFK